MWLTGDPSQTSTQEVAKATGYIEDLCGTAGGGCGSLTSFGYFYQPISIPTQATIGSPVIINGISEFPVTFYFTLNFNWWESVSPSNYCTSICFPAPGNGWTYQFAVYEFYANSTQPYGWTYYSLLFSSAVDFKNLGNPSCHVGSCSAGDPIDAASGNVYDEVTDYQTAGTNALSFTRYYNSTSFDRLGSCLSPPCPGYAAELGYNWRSTYDRYLGILSSTYVFAERADGSVFGFTLTNGVWTTDSDVDMTLTQTGSTTWTLQDSNDTVETYTVNASGEGFLSSITLRDGYMQTLTYNSNSQLIQVSDSYGRALQFTYNDSTNQALLTQVTTPDNLVLTYGYNSTGLIQGEDDQLASVSYNTSPVTSLSYQYTNSSFPLALTGIQDENGNLFESWTYDAQGRALTNQRSNGADLMTIAYDDTTGNRTVTNALGQQELYKFTLLQGVPKVTEIDRLASSTVPAAIETFTYDSNGYIASETDWNGNLTTYVNNALGLPTSITEASGTALARTTTITYDSTFVHLPHQIIAPRKTASFTYDSKGNMLTYTETDTSGGPTNGQTRTWTYTYDSTGHVLTATGPRTDVTQTTTYTYSGNNIATLTDALGHITRYTSYNGSGLLLSMTDPNGVVTTFTYDTRDRLLTQTVQASSGNATTGLSYDAAEELTKITLPDGSWFGFTYDSAHRLTQMTDKAGDKMSYTLDANNDITKQQLFNASNVLQNTQSAVFDSLGRMVQRIGAASQTTTYTYDANGNLLSSQDPLGNTTTYTYDALNRLAKSVDPLTNTTTYTYDAQDHLTNVTDPRGLMTTYTYDGFGQLISQTSPDTGKTTYTLDKAGNRISETDARGVVTNRTFDKLDRVLTITYPASPGENITYTYDASSASNDGIGRLTGTSDESGTIAYTYNARGDILTDTRVINGKSYTTAYSYSLADTVSGITYPSGDTVTYSLDSMGRPISATLKAAASSTTTTLVSNITYDPFGSLTGLTYGNGLTSTYSYDQDYRLTGIVTSGTSKVQNLSLAYDAASNITSITDALDSTRNQTFTYDADYRLTKAVGKYGTQTYTYDADGNRTSLTSGGVTTNYTYAATSNQLVSTSAGSSTCSFTYTANGDLATENCGFTSATKLTYATTFTTGAANHEEQVLVKRNPPPGATFASTSVTATNAYNALDERMLKTIAGGAVTSYTYDEHGQLLAESNGTTGAVTREYVWVDGRPVAQIEANGTIYYIHTEQTGTPQKMTNASQAVVWDRVQDPFGQTVSISGPATDNLRFPGQYFDSETSLNYNWNRSLDTSTGRYTQADPIGLRGGINEYTYVEGNPLRWVDPSGTDASKTLLSICAALALCSTDPAEDYHQRLNDQTLHEQPLPPEEPPAPRWVHPQENPFEAPETMESLARCPLPRIITEEPLQPLVRPLVLVVLGLLDAPVVVIAIVAAVILIPTGAQ